MEEKLLNKETLGHYYANGTQFLSDYPHHWQSSKDGFIEGFGKADEMIRNDLPVANVVRRNAKIMDAEYFEAWYNQTFK